MICDDAAQRDQALNPHKSFIIQAPAGSGKTELLIQRFLVLLSHVNSPEEILAITFTKKSANEMRLRIVKALKQAATHAEPESLHAKKTWYLARKVLIRNAQLNWNLIDNPNQLSIQTIDSLCAYLTRQLPLLSNFGSPPDISEQPFYLYSEAVQEILTHVENKFSWSQAIANLLLHLDNDLNKLHHLLTHLLSKREQWLPYIRLNAEEIEIKNDLERYLKTINQEHINYLHKIFPIHLSADLIAITQFASNNLNVVHVDPHLFLLRRLNSLPNDKATWLGLAKFLLTKNFTWRKRLDSEIGFPPLTNCKNLQEKTLQIRYRKLFSELISAFENHTELQLALKELFFLPDEKYSEKQWNVLQSLLAVLKILPAQLRLTFQKYGQIDFIENSQAALTALGNEDHPTDLALALDYQIQHILIDEFQDTSISQYQLIKKLLAGWQENDGRTLFVVGDPMQSIYRFREAEVGLFLHMCNKGIANIRLTTLVLTKNFRSHPAIVNWNNEHYVRMFPSENNIDHGAVTFSESIAHTADNDANIKIFGLIAADDKLHANKIADHVKTLMENSSDKIAILVRSRSHLSAIIPALRAANIPYRAVDIDVLESKQHIQDVLSLTFALLHPMDRISWLSILRAPWCGLTLNDLYLIAHSNPHASIWQQLANNDIIARVSIEGKQRLARVIEVLKTQLAERERQNLRIWIENTWLQLGGPACLQQYEDNHDIHSYFNFLDEFTRTNPFFNREKFKDKISRLYAPPQYDDQVLQIMTIHTAKGLEFDTVILPHLEKKIPHDDKALLAWLEKPLTDGQTALLLASIHRTGSDKDTLYEYILRQQKIKSDYEIDRLLYVATTRAKKNLYLFFNVDNAKNMRVQSGSFLNKLWPSFKNNLDKILIPVTKNDTDIAKLPRYVKRLSANWQHPYDFNSQAISAIHQQTSGFKLIDNKWQIIGMTIHKILQKISEFGIDWWLQQSLQNQNDYFKKQFTLFGLTLNHFDYALQLSQRAINKTLQDEKGKWILTPHQDARSEFAISIMLNNKIENLIIDRTFIDATNTRWIIDYKTAATEDNPEKFIAAEIKKYQQQMDNYLHAMQIIDTRPIRLGLYFPSLAIWKELTVKDCSSF